MIRSLLVIVWIFLVSIIFASLAILASLIDKTGNLSHLSARVWARSILFANRTKVAIKGLSHIDPSKSYIYMSNHQSSFDIFVLLAYLKVQFRWLAKAELFRIPLFGFAMKRAGYISIDRSNRRAAFTSLKKASESIRGGVSVIIFPEGTRSLDGNIRSFKSGGFVLAVDSGVPIVPVILHGTRSIMAKERLRIKPGNVLLEITQPVETSEFIRKTRNDLLDKIRQIICDSFEKGRSDRP